MSSDRAIYDKPAYLVKTDEASKPLSYILDINRQENCRVCGDAPNVTEHGQRVALESELFGHSRKLSRDPKDKVQKGDTLSVLPYSNPLLCDRNLQSDTFRDQSNNEYIEQLKRGERVN